MGDNGIFCTTAEVVRKAGANANSAGVVEAFTNDFVTQAESTINAATRFNWSDVYTTLDVDVQGILKEAASNLAAIYCINYDMSGYTSRTEAELMIAVLRDGALRAISILKDIKARDFVNGA